MPGRELGPGRDSSLSVIGEPGIGKSRVVAEGIERISAEGLEPHRVLPGRCLSYGQSVSLWLIADLVRSLCSLAEDAGLEAVRRTGHGRRRGGPGRV